MKIYLTRHGQNEDNEKGILNGHRDKPLTELGLKQAKEIASIIKTSKINITKVFSSPLSRAYETAEIIAIELKLPSPEVLELLIERDFGSMTGKLISDIKSSCSPNILQTDTVTYFLSAENSETFDQLILRAKELLEVIKEKRISEDILLVCHGDIGKMIYAAFYDISWQEALREFHFGNTEILLLDKESLPQNRHIIKTKQFNC